MKKRIFPVIVTAIILFIASASFAAPILTNGTLADFVALGSGGGQIDDVLFYDFSYTGTSSGGASAIPAGGINVTVVNTPLTPGLVFSAPWNVTSGQTLESVIQFYVQVQPGGNPIDVFNLFFQLGGHSGTGSIQVDLSALPAFPTMGPFQTGIDLKVLGGANGSISLSSLTVNFPQLAVPEPGTLLLLGSGLIGIAAFGRKRFSKK